MNQKQLFFAELGAYMKVVSEETPVGVCTLCGSIRARSDVNGKEACPALLIENLDSEKLPPIKDMAHKWQAAKSKEDLEKLLAAYFPNLKHLSQSLQQILPEEN